MRHETRTNELGFALAQPNLQRNGEGIVQETGFLYLTQKPGF